MMRDFYEMERHEWRVLAALRPVDGTTGMALRGPLDISGARARIVRNRSGLYVIHEWSRLAAHASAFDAPPALPAPGSERLELVLRDPVGRYLPRLASIDLPRDPRARRGLALRGDGRAALSERFGRARYQLDRSTRQHHRQRRRRGLGGALLRIVAGGEVLARGMSDWRGEALVPVVGVPVTTWSEDEGAVVVTSIAATVEVYFDPALGTRTPIVDVRAGASRRACPCSTRPMSKTVVRPCRRPSRT